MTGRPNVIRCMQVAKAQEGAGDNHAVSAMKFRVLRNFLKLGYSVFLSDVDICVFDNPFKYLVRDSDIEGMSDGFDNATAYGGTFYLLSNPDGLFSPSLWRCRSAPHYMLIYSFGGFSVVDLRSTTC